MIAIATTEPRFVNFHQKLIAIATMYVGPTAAEDVVQTSYAKFLTNSRSDQVPKERSLFVYLSQIVRHTAIDLTRHRNRHYVATTNHDDSVLQMGVIYDDLDKADLQDKIAVFHRTLTCGQRELIFLRFHRGLSLKTIAERQGVTPQTVRNRLRAIFKLGRRCFIDWEAP